MTNEQFTEYVLKQRLASFKKDFKPFKKLIRMFAVDDQKSHRKLMVAYQERLNRKEFQRIFSIGIKKTR